MFSFLLRGSCILTILVLAMFQKSDGRGRWGAKHFKLIGEQKNRAYYFSLFRGRFSDRMRDAYDSCKSVGGYLLELNSREEQHFVQKLLLSNSECHGHSTFTGITDVGHEGRWTSYHSGKEITRNMVDWARNAPNTRRGNSNDCMSFDWRRGKPVLVDLDCGIYRSFICEVSK